MQDGLRADYCDKNGVKFRRPFQWPEKKGFHWFIFSRISGVMGPYLKMVFGPTKLQISEVMEFLILSKW